MKTFVAPRTVVLRGRIWPARIVEGWEGPTTAPIRCTVGRLPTPARRALGAVPLPDGTMETYHFTGVDAQGREVFEAP